MMRSLWSGVAGLKTHQIQMDVIGNNVANVNTTSYKAQKTTFGDLLYQNARRANGPTQVRGGTNAKQVGLGAKYSAIMTNIAKQGSIQQTDSVFDLSITGDSFFVIENHKGEMNYSRDGSFTVDAQGYLVTRADGYYVRGIQAADDAKTAEDLAAGATDRLQILPIGEDGNLIKMDGEATSYARVTGNISRTDDLLDPNKGRTVDLEFYGADGKTYTVRMKFDNAGDDNDSTYRANITGIMDENHQMIEGGVPENLSVALTYDPETGKFTGADGNANGQIQLQFEGDAAAAGGFTLDFSGTTNYAPLNGASSSALATYRGDREGNGEGYPEGDMNGVAIARDGTITRLYSNGQNRVAGKIAVAEFANVTGLNKEGENLYSVTGNSGPAQLMWVNDDGGYMTSGTLEMSNVDLSTEFTDMIITQRGFQANSRVITVSDTLLDELRQLKR
ncbi:MULTISPECIES: flagellar hook protein FlgE [unclassified Butyrivibrio]|uniref:flagellar hook protein FlgE n=1 Tax=unclassified Butyrivibrio TaxID=2639466 RepID=UPI0003B705F1|nr:MULTISPECIES: flagellar hook-basal body complex protein [unclassified Butyrivibrio]